MLVESYLILFMLTSATAVTDNTKQSDHTLKDYRLKQFFNTRTDDMPFQSASTNNLITNLPENSRVTRSKSFDDLWCNSHNQESRYPPFHHQTMLHARTTLTPKIPKFMLKISSSDPMPCASNVSPVTVNAELAKTSNKEYLNIPSQQRQLRKESSLKQQKNRPVPNFSRHLPKSSNENRYSSVTGHILNEYFQT